MEIIVNWNHVSPVSEHCRDVFDNFPLTNVRLLCLQLQPAPSAVVPAHNGITNKAKHKFVDEPI